MLIRPAARSDAEAVASVHLAARRSATMPPGIHPDGDVRRWLARRLGQDDVWVAELDGEVVGYARFTPTWLDDLYVLPTYAGQGVGSALLDLVKAQRPDGFCLWVFEMNTPARGFYARHGLIELEHTDGSANEEKRPDLRMAWLGAEPLRYLRSLIDEVDEQLGDLLARRAALTAAVQDIKHDTTRDPDRERAIAAALARRAPALGEERLARIAHVIISESLDAAGH
ncbi:GNAT family N-acetyltransferase [Nocardioides mangrovi]|uniref:GNAT family N-acetyltransferase n=1 Tax=Nocardioides mangrovi TaxID=2874580 RepID=A0ABS7U838_9ACTN|nr:GNAT family N-acetyltransferase [Nocardioides mangrovi]MBZ5736827.1 GNAT family N-acetyltransferase [Nocardioides mangrovi]